MRRRPRRVTAAGMAMGFAMLLILAACIFLLAVVFARTLAAREDMNVSTGQSGIAATITTVPTGTVSTGFTNTTATTGADSIRNAVLIRPTAAAASSTLQASQTNSYGVTNLLDGDVTTAWNEGQDGNGIGEWVQFNFSQDVVILRIEIANGYQKDDQRYQGNPRVQSLKVEYSNGTSQLVDLLDNKQLQIITPTREPITSVRLVIVSVYPGAEWDDTALSEVRFYKAAE
jgi:hypothetical protein